MSKNSHEALYNKGNALYSLGRLEEAIEFYDKALKIKPELHDALNNKGNALDDLGRLEEAIEFYDKALKIKPDYHLALNNKGVALDNLGRLEEAIECYDKALKIKSDYHEALNNKGLALYNLGRLEEAIECYDKALKIKPDYHLALNNKGLALYNLGRLEEAIECYDKALKIKPDYKKAEANRQDAIKKLKETNVKRKEIKSTYDVFICYCWRDREDVFKLIDLLIGEGIKCCVSLTNEAKLEKVKTSILSSKLFLICLSDKLLNSIDCLNITYFALQHKPNKFVIPINFFQISCLPAQHKLSYLLKNTYVENINGIICEQDSMHRKEREKFLSRFRMSLK